jgi:hypothetical protein
LLLIWEIKDELDHKKVKVIQMPVAHASNTSYSGGRDQEDHSWKPALANTFSDPISKETFNKNGVTQGEDPEFKHPY